MTTQTEIVNSKQPVQPPLPIKHYKWPYVLVVLVILAIVSAGIILIPTALNIWIATFLHLRLPRLATNTRQTNMLQTARLTHKGHWNLSQPATRV